MLTISVKGIDNAGRIFSGKVPPGTLSLDDTTGDIPISFNNPVEYNLRVSEVSGGILVAGDLSTKFEVPCGRCLESFEYDVHLNDICHFIEDSTADIIDISEELREDILISLPTRFVCGDECAGLCQVCGANLNEDTCECARNAADSKSPSPWDVLDQL